MYVWSEEIASRGCQEVGSCLIKHLQNHIPESTKTVILFSDSCGGQNRSIKMTLMLKKYLSSHSTIDVIKQKFFVPGHSYNRCDGMFGLIEAKQNLHGNIYTPNEWIELIRTAKVMKPLFHVTQMQAADFFSTANLEKIIVNRKKDIDGRKINWFGFRAMLYSKNDLFIIKVQEDEIVKKFNIQRKHINEEIFESTEMDLLYPSGRPIDKLKYEDLMDLMKYTPKEHHPYFINLRNDNEAIDYGLASDSDNDNNSDSDSP